MKDENAFNWNKFNIPAWFITVVGVAIAVGTARADVVNMKDRVEKLEALPQQFSAMQADLRTVKDSQSEMRQDIKTLLQRGR